MSENKDLDTLAHELRRLLLEEAERPVSTRVVKEFFRGMAAGVLELLLQARQLSTVTANSDERGAVLCWIPIARVPPFVMSTKSQFRKRLVYAFKNHETMKLGVGVWTAKAGWVIVDDEGKVLREGFPADRFTHARRVLP